MMRSEMRVAAVVSGLVIAGIGLLALAGDLNPPAGPVTPTMKSLDQVEPRIAVNAVNTPGDGNSTFQISQPGSYYLTGNITGSVSHSGIEIVANGVTLDLNGFELVGVPGSLDGVTVPGGSLRNIMVRNGTVRNWGDHGIDLRATSCEVASINASSNGAGGIRLGDNNTARDCRASINAGIGITTGNANVVTNCVTGSNTGTGMLIGTDCVVTQCVAISNLSSGFVAGAGSQIVGCTARINVDGIVGTAGGVLIADCTAILNVGNGIVLSSDSRATNNISHDNTAAGIQIDGSSNRVEDNQCSDNGIGVNLAGAGNIVRSNTCSGNATNWIVAAGNVCLVVQAATGGAFNGNAGGTSPGALVPNTNFSY